METDASTATCTSPKDNSMPGQKRDCRGKPRASEAPVVRNEFTSMFEHFRDELDAHHDRRERIIKASRDVTALSKKIIFSLQRLRREVPSVRKIEPSLPPHIQKETQARLGDISKLLATIAVEVQGINRYRYARQMSCVEELVEALTFDHYLRTQSLLGYHEAVAQVAALSRPGDPHEDSDHHNQEDPVVDVSEQDYLMGIFDLSGEMMRFATVIAALNGTMAGRERTINADMQDLGSFFEMLPGQHGKSYQTKLETMRQSVLKVERLGYGLKVRGSERPAGWMPDTAVDAPPDVPYDP